MSNTNLNYNISHDIDEYKNDNNSNQILNLSQNDINFNIKIQSNDESVQINNVNDDLKIINFEAQEQQDQEQNNSISINNQQDSMNQLNDEQSEKVLINVEDISRLRIIENEQNKLQTEESFDEIQSAIFKALSKRPKERRPSHLNEVVKIMEKLPFFQKYIEDDQRDILVKCCQQMDLETYEKGSNVFEIGTIGEKFYLILEGEVEVYSKIPNSSSGYSPLIHQGQGNQTTKNKNVKLNNFQQTPTNIIKIKNFSQMAQKQINIDSEVTADNKEKQEKNIDIEIIQSTINSKDNKISSNLDELEEFKIEKGQLGQDQQENIQEEQQYGLSQINDSLPMSSEIIMSSARSYESPIKTSIRENNLNTIQEQQFLDLMLVKILKQGQSFGELSLIYNKPRLATIKCSTNCVFAVLQKKQYVDILKNAEQKNIVKAIDKLSEIPIFKRWSFESLKDIYLNSEVIQFKKGEIVFQKDDPSDFAYIVLSGEFSIRNKYESTSQNVENDVLLQKLESINKDGIDQLLKQPSSQRQKAFTLLKMCTNEMFGEEDLLKEQNRSFEVYCSSLTGSLLVIKQIDFRLRVFERNESIQEYILDRLQTKEMLLQEKEQNLKEQFYKYKNYLVENRKELKNLIFSQLLLDQSCSIPLQDANSNLQEYNQTNKNISQINKIQQSPNKHKLQSSSNFESPRSKLDNTFVKQSNSIFTQNSIMSNHLDSPIIDKRNTSQIQNISRDSNHNNNHFINLSKLNNNNQDKLNTYFSKNENTQNSFQNYITEQNKERVSEYGYYNNNNIQNKKIKFKQNIILSQRSHSDSSRNYNTKTKTNPQSTFEFLDLSEDYQNTRILTTENQDQSYNPHKISPKLNPDSIRDRQILIQIDKSPQHQQRQIKIFGKEGNNPELTTGQTNLIKFNESNIQVDHKVSNHTNNLNSQKNNYQQPTSSSQSSTPQPGFFQIEVSKRKRIMMSSKYDYQNYLCDKDGQEKKERYLIPMKRILDKTLKQRSPLLIQTIKSPTQVSETQNTQNSNSQNNNREQIQQKNNIHQMNNHKNNEQINNEYKCNDCQNKAQEQNNLQNSPIKIIKKNELFKMKRRKTNLNISTNNSNEVINLSQKVTPKSGQLKSYYQYTTKNSPSENDTYYDIQTKMSPIKQQQYQNQRQSCKSADSQFRSDFQKVSSNIFDIIQNNFRKQTIMNQNTTELIRPKTQNNQHQLIPFQIIPYDDETTFKDKQAHKIISKKCTAATFLEQEQYIKLIQERSPQSNLSPKKIIESYKQYLLDKQQSIEKSKKLGAYTAFNKTKDTAFYIQKRAEKKIIQTITDWKRSSSLIQSTDFQSYNIQQNNHTLPMKNRNSITNQNNKTQSVSFNLQPYNINPVNNTNNLKGFKQIVL